MKGAFLADHNNVVTWVPSKMIAKRLEMSIKVPEPEHKAPAARSTVVIRRSNR